MDEKIARTIRALGTWDDVRQFEANARTRSNLTDEILAAIGERSTELGLKLIAEKTGIDATALTPAQRKIVRAASEYVGVMRQQGKYPERTLKQLRNRGLIDAAENAVCRSKPTQGYQTLVDADLEDLAYERIVLDHPDEFSPRAIWYSRRTLGLPNASETAPAATHGDTQTRTATLLQWLKSRAAEGDGVIPPFSNADAAWAMDMEDMSRFGQVHGNIQSRVDFACYQCNLPPLGCAADAPFARAWSTEARVWSFPVSDMQAAAQSKAWSAIDFDRILREAEQLPAHAHLSWKDALATDEAKVKAWALSFVGSGQPRQPIEHGERDSSRNAVWTRDELILALNLYLRHRTSPPRNDSAEVIELSAFLNAMGTALGLADTEGYRYANGVYMKMMNFRRFDHGYVKEGKVGLTRGNKDEEVVWAEFANDPDRLGLVCEPIRSAVENPSSDSALGGIDEPDIHEAEEGRVLTRLHRVSDQTCPAMT